MTVPTLSNVTFLFRLDPGLVAWGHGSTVPRSIQEEEKEGWKGKGQEGKREKGKEEVVLSSRHLYVVSWRTFATVNWSVNGTSRYIELLSNLRYQ